MSNQRSNTSQPLNHRSFSHFFEVLNFIDGTQSDIKFISSSPCSIAIPRWRLSRTSMSQEPKADQRLQCRKKQWYAIEETAVKTSNKQASSGDCQLKLAKHVANPTCNSWPYTKATQRVIHHMFLLAVQHMMRKACFSSSNAGQQLVSCDHLTFKTASLEGVN